MVNKGILNQRSDLLVLGPWPNQWLNKHLCHIPHSLSSASFSLKWVIVMIKETMG